MDATEKKIIGDTIGGLCDYYEKKRDVLIVSIYHKEGETKEESMYFLSTPYDNEDMLSAIELSSGVAAEGIRKRKNNG